MSIPEGSRPLLLRERARVRGSRLALAFVATTAALCAALGLFGIVLSIVQRLGGSTITTTMQLGNGEIPEFVSKSALITDARYADVLATFTNVDSDSKWLFALTDACYSAMFLGVALVVLVMAVRTIRGRTFAHSMTWSVAACAVIVLVCGTAAQYLEAAGKASLVQLVGARDLTAGGNLTDPSYEGFVGYALALNPTPVLIGLALLALAAAFAAGHRMQRDIEGLV